MGLFDGLFGGSESKSRGSYIDPGQKPYLASLWYQGRQLSDGTQQRLENLRPLSWQLTQQNLGQLGNLMGYGQGLGGLAQGGAVGQLGGLAGMGADLGALGQFINPTQTAQGLNRSLQQDLGRFYRQELLPGIADQATGYGQSGGSRQGVAQGLAAQGLLDAFQRGAAQNNFQSVGLAQQAAGQLGQLNLADLARRAQAAQLGGGLQQSALLGAGGLTGGAIGLGGDVFQQAMAGPLAPYAGLQALASIIGGPAIIGGQTSSSGTNGLLPGIGSLFGGLGAAARGFGWGGVTNG